MKVIVSTLFLLLITLNANVTQAAAEGLQPQLAISPSRLEITGDESKKIHSLTVLNLGEKSLKVEVSVQNWDFDDNNNYRALAPTAQSLDQWLIINPIRLEIPAKGQQTVRLAVRPKAKPEDGEHRAMVFFKQIKRDDAKGVNVLFNIGVPVYAYFGEVKREATLNSIDYSESGRSLMMDVSSQGNSYVRPQGFFLVTEPSSLDDDELLKRLDAKTGEVDGVEAILKGKLSAKPVFAGERRKVVATLDGSNELPKNYTLVVKFELAGTLYEKVFHVKDGL